MADLKQSLAESCENLKLCRIRAAYYVQDKEKQLQADDILNCYDFFEWLIEQLFDVINSVFFRVTQIDEKLQISVHVMSSTDIHNFLKERPELLIQQEEEQEQKRLLENYKGRESVTKSGKKIHVFANIGSVSDVAYVLENDAEGIGLFRSEFLYLGRSGLPDENEQFNAYRQVLQMMAGKKVVIRTLDIGADKNVDYLGLGQEDNPAMGYRAIRICLEQPDIFKTQLRALLRAAKYGNLAIMYPMIISVEEVKSIGEIVKEVAKELEEEKVPYTIPEQGIMVETPAAVMMSEELAELVDFFSIGTNDLTQYTLAIDRQNSKLDRFYNPHHEAVLRMIQRTIDGAHKHGRWVGICGELGADTALTERFVQMGIDELSVAPSMVLPVRSKICEME